MSVSTKSVSIKGIGPWNLAMEMMMVTPEISKVSTNMSEDMEKRNAENTWRNMEVESVFSSFNTL